MRRLSEVVVTLGSDRDQLVARIGSLERSLEDMTGALHRQALPIPAEPAEPLPATTASPAAPSATQPPLPQPRPQEAPQPEAAMASAPSAAAGAPPSDPAAAARPGAPAREAPDAEPAAAREFGVDIGGATRFDRLRALWHSTRNANPALLEGLHPITAVRESKSGGVDLRLIVGPLASTEAATQLCAALVAARRHCQMTTFEGQPLALTPPEPERRAAPAHRNSALAPAPTANPAAPATSNSPPAATGSSNPAPIASSTRMQAGGRP
jgi:hypothetical protein